MVTTSLARAGRTFFTAWGRMINRSRLPPVQPQAAGSLGLSGIHRLDPRPDDLGHIGAGVDAQGEGADHGKVAAGAKMTMPIMSSCTIMGVPRMTVTYTLKMAFTTPSTALR